MAYEAFTRTTGASESAGVSVNNAGRIGINRAAVNVSGLAEETRVVLMWDSARKRFAIKATRDKADVGAFRLSHTKDSTALSAKTFFVFIGYDFAGFRRFPATWNSKEKMLEIQLSSNVLKKREGRKKTLNQL